MSVTVPADPTAAFRVEIRKLPAFFRRDFLVAWSYRLSFFSDWIGLLIQVVIFSFVGKLVNPAKIPSFGGQPATYMEFVAVGIALSSFMGIALGRVYAVVRQEQVQGTLESLLLTPTAFTTIQMGSVAYDMAYVPVRTTVFFAMTTLLFGTHFYWSGLLPTFAILAGLIPFVWGLGILAASYTVTFKQGTGVVGLLTTILTVGSGSYFPVTVLPSWSQGLAKLSPLTLALNAARGAMLGGTGWDGVWPTVAVLAGCATITLTGGMIAFRAALARERRRGSLGLY
jgi:ABC-2 type transport system permease protein